MSGNSERMQWCSYGERPWYSYTEGYTEGYDEAYDECYDEAYDEAIMVILHVEKQWL